FPGRLHMQNGALNHPLEAERGLRVHFVPGDDRGMLIDKVGEQLAQLLDVRRTSTQDLRGRRVVEQREQQMLHGDELVALLPSVHECHVQADFKLLRDHYNSFASSPEELCCNSNFQFSSITHCRGCSCLREKAITC